MLGAIYIGLSGMNAFSRGLQTISNNVANMNSPGFKASSVSFTDVFNVGGLGSAYAGHSNQSAGAGVRFGNPGIDFRQGDMRQSGGDLDFAVQGSGFMVLSGPGGRTYYTRTGQFAVNDDGYLALQGSEYYLNILGASGQPSPLNIDALRYSDPLATTTVKLGGSIGTGLDKKVIEDVEIFDALGQKHNWTVTLERDPLIQGDWTVKVTDKNTGAPIGSDKTISFDPVMGDLDPDSWKLDLDVAGRTVTLDLEGVKIEGSGTNSSLAVDSIDGNGVMALASVTLTEEGKIKLTYARDGTKAAVTKEVGAVALADFSDPQQLERLGDGLFHDTGGSARILESGAQGIGKLVSRQLEASNVDLAQQFGDLILIQRGFQASSQVVSVSNDMIQQLFGIRGQG